MENSKVMMPCCDCGEEFDITATYDGRTGHKWFGAYRRDKIYRLICAICVKKPRNKYWWRNGEIK